jgi:hypothetical protein
LALAASGEASEEQGLAEGSEQISEYRDRLLQYVKSLLPNYPEYVLKDWLVPNKGDFSNLPDTDLKNGIMEKLKLAGLTPNTKWQLVPDMKFTMAMFDPMTKQRLIGRAGGHSDLGMGIPRDKERHATQAALAQQQGGVRKEPVLLIKTAKGYELLEGWHRTIQHFARYPDGYVGPAYVAVAQGQQGVAEGKLKINYDSWLSKVPNTINDKMKKVLRVMQDGKVRSRADMLRAAGIDPNPRSPGGVAGMEGTDYYLYKKGLLDVVDIVKGQKYFKISKNASQGVLETNVAKYKDLGATNQTTHFIKNVTTGKIVSPHRSLQDAEDSLVGNMRDSNDKFKIVRARKGVAEGSKHNQQDLDDVADWMNTTPDKLSVEVKQEPIEKFIKQIREMYGTYDEFPEDEDRTNRILKLLKRGAKPLPIYVEAGDPHLFVMEGRHRMVAFWLAEMKTIPVAYVSINSQQGVAEGSAADGSVNYTLGHTPDAEYVYSIYRDGKKEGTYHSVDQAREIMGNMKRTSPNREYKIKRGARNKMAGPASQLPEQGIAEAHNFKGSFPFDVDHMGGTRGINLPSAPTKKFFTDKKQWSQTVDDINSSKYDDNSEYSGTTGRTTVSIDNREWARWSDAQEKGYIEMSSMTEQDISEAHGNYAGDRPVNLGGVSMKKIQIGDTVRYIDQKAQVVDMSRDREHARITIPSSATTKTVLTSDLRPLGRGVSEETLSELSPATLARYKTKAGAAATAADSAGDRRTGDRRFSGIVKATKKQFDQDAKQSAQAVHESRLRLMASIIKTQ